MRFFDTPEARRALKAKVGPLEKRLDQSIDDIWGRIDELDRDVSIAMLIASIGALIALALCVAVAVH